MVFGPDARGCTYAWRFSQILPCLSSKLMISFMTPHMPIYFKVPFKKQRDLQDSDLRKLKNTSLLPKDGIRMFVESSAS